jgi:hypothetical protein
MSVSVAEKVLVDHLVVDEAAPVPWWEGLWFEGPLDPRGTAFAVLLALAATVAMLVIATAVARIATGG